MVDSPLKWGVMCFVKPADAGGEEGDVVERAGAGCGGGFTLIRAIGMVFRKVMR